MHDICRMLLAVRASEGNQSGMDGACREDRVPGGPKKLISGTRALYIMRGVRHDYMLKRCGNAVVHSTARARRHGMLRRPMDAAIGARDVPPVREGPHKVRRILKVREGRQKVRPPGHHTLRGGRATLGP